MKPTKILIGSSVRAAAMSAIRKGEVPYCIDLFADRDLVRIAETVRCPMADYPHGLPRLLAQAPNVPWDYTGGLENHPDLIAEMMQIRPLVGNPPEVLKLVRDPFWLAHQARTFGFPFPKISFDPDEIDGEVLRKPFAGSGGRGISRSRERHPDYYFQNWLEGEAFSVVYRDGLCAGESSQIVGLSSLNAPEFAWCGCLGVDLSPDSSGLLPSRLRAFLDFLVRETGLRGDFGFDLISVDRQDRTTARLLEVNPRYTASMEVVEYALGRGFFHKVVLFADRDLVFPEDGPWMESLSAPFDPNVPTSYADIPHPGERIEVGWPILSTLWVDGVGPQRDLSILIDEAKRALGMT